MEESSAELEEGEAYYYPDEERADVSDNIDPDIALSYIDEKIEDLLGHFQRNFDQPVISAETLGPAFGDWGSFLPTYARSPLSRQKTPDRSNISNKSRDNISSVAVLRNLPVPSSRLKNSLSNADNLLDKKFPGGNLSVKQVNREPVVSSVPIADVPSEDGTADKLGNGTEKRTLKVLIKMGSDKNAKTNAALYSGLGLEDSPSTSLGSSSRETGVFPSVSVGVSDESPSNIIEVMTSLPVHCSELMTPLHEDLLAFVKEGVFAMDNNPADNIKASAGHKVVSMDQSGTIQGYAMPPKAKKIKPETTNERPVEVNKGNLMSIRCKQACPTKNKSKNQMPNGEVSMRYEEKTSFPCPGNVSREFGKMASKASEVKDAYHTKAKRKLCSEHLESPVKLIPDPIYAAEVERKQKHTVPKAKVHGISGTGSVMGQFDLKENGNGRRKSEEVHMLSKGTQFVANNEVAEEGNHIKGKSGHEAPPLEHNGTSILLQDEKAAVGRKKKSKGGGLDDKAYLSGQDKLSIVAGISVKDKKESDHDIPISTKREEVKLTSGKRIKGLGKRVDALQTYKGEQNHVKTPSNGKQKNGNSIYPGVENDIFSNSREISRNGNSSFPGASVEGAVDALPSAPIAEMATAAASLLENWVSCDLCGRWRLLPMGIKPEDLPEKWMCSLLDWLPGMNSCDIAEDVTTGMMRGLIPHQGLESQGHANGSMIGTSSNYQNLGQNPQNLSTVEIDGRAKGILSPKKMLKKLKAGAVESKHLNHMDQSVAEQNSLRRCNFLESKSQEVALNILKKKEDLDIGDTKPIKEKNKRKSGQFEANETPKRPKREESNNRTKCGNSDALVCGTGLSSRTPELTIVKDKVQLDEMSSAKEVKHVRGGKVRVSVSTQAQGPSDSPSANMKNVVKGSSSMKKRKLNGSQGNQINGEPCHHSAEDSKLVTEETGECIIGKEKKSRVEDTLVRDMISKGGNNSLRKEGKGIRVSSSPFGRNNYTDRMEDQLHPSKNRKPPKQATSSSSKVSGSQKSRVKYEVQGSPVESVSSSPLKIPRPDISSRGNAVTGRLPVVENVMKGSHDKFNGGSKLSGAVAVKGSRGYQTKSPKSSLLIKGVAKPSPMFENSHNLDGNTDYGNGVCMKQSGTALPLLKNDPSLVCNGKVRSSIDKGKIKAVAKVGEGEREHQNKRVRQESFLKVDSSQTFGGVESHLHSHPGKKNEKNESKGRHLSDENKLVDSDVQRGNHYSDYGLQSPSENTCSDSNRPMGAAPVSVESLNDEAKMASHLYEEENQETFCQSTHLVNQRSTCNGVLVEATINGELSRRKKRDAANILERCALEVHGAKNVLSSSSLGANQAIHTASSILEEAEKLRELADRLKGTNFGFEGKESYFEAALKFLQGASLLETGGGESGKHGEMTPIQVYVTAAKLCESCAAEFEKCQELASAALAYKCIEVAYLRVVYCKYASLNRDRQELQATLNQSESPSSSASDIDNLNNHSVADRSNLSKGALSHAVGNHIVVARNLPSISRLIDFTQDFHLAMEAMRKSKVAFTAACSILEDSQKKDHIVTSLKKVISFSFQDIDGLLRLVQLAREAVSRSGFCSAKE